MCENTKKKNNIHTVPVGINIVSFSGGSVFMPGTFPLTHDESVHCIDKQ